MHDACPHGRVATSSGGIPVATPAPPDLRLTALVELRDDAPLEGQDSLLEDLHVLQDLAVAIEQIVVLLLLDVRLGGSMLERQPVALR